MAEARRYLKKYTPEEKEMAVARLMAGDRSVVIAREMDIPVGTVRYWKWAELKDGDKTFLAHSKQRDKFVEKVWKVIDKGLRRISRGLDEIEVTKPYDIKQLATVIGILYDKAMRAQMVAPPSGDRPVDLSGWSTEKLRIMVAEFERKAQTSLPTAFPLGPSAQAIEGEAREILDE